MNKWMCFLMMPLLALAGCGDRSDSGRIQVAYVTNGIDPFWTIAEAGALAGAEAFDVDCEVLMPPKGLPDQIRMIESLLVNGIDGVAISPIDAANQVSFLNDVAAQTNLITQDSDAPDCDRLCFIGMNNYDAGREAGKMVKDALPDGGEIMIFVGRLEQLNAQQRRQGVIDELLNRPVQNVDEMKTDGVGDKIVGDKYTILGTLTDNFDTGKAKANAEDAMAANENLAGMVGLFAYNMPACLEAVKSAKYSSFISCGSFSCRSTGIHPGETTVHRNAPRCQFTGQTPIESVLATLRRHVRRKIRNTTLKDFGADINDPAGFSFFHVGQNGPRKKKWALDKKSPASTGRIPNRTIRSVSAADPALRSTP